MLGLVHTNYVSRLASLQPSPSRRKSRSPGMRTSRLRRTPASWCPGSDTRKIAVVPSTQAPATGTTPGSPITRTWCLLGAAADNPPGGYRGAGRSVLSGGIGRDELSGAGATAIYDGPADLLARFPADWPGSPAS